MDRPSRSTHVTGALIGVGFVAVGIQRLSDDAATLGVVCLVAGLAFAGWHVRRFLLLRTQGQDR